MQIDQENIEIVIWNYLNLELSEAEKSTGRRVVAIS